MALAVAALLDPLASAGEEGRKYVKPERASPLRENADAGTRLLLTFARAESGYR